MKRYIAIDFTILREHNLSLEKWALLENIYFMSNNDYKACYASKKSLAEWLGITERQIYRIINDLISDNFIIKNEFNHLKITQKWLDILMCREYDKMSVDTMTKCHTLPIKNEIRSVEKKRERKNIKKEFSFSLTKETQYQNLSQEYKDKLFAFCLSYDGAENYEDFLLSLEAKGYKYKNFKSAYAKWNRQHKKEFRQVESLGKDWIGDISYKNKIYAINTKTWEITQGTVKKQPYEEPQPTETNTQEPKRVNELLKNTTRRIS